MSPLPVISNTYRCTLNWENVGLHAANVMHVAVAAVDEDAIFAAVDDKVTADMWKGVRSTASVTSVDVIKLDGLGATHRYLTGSPAKWSGGQTTGEFSVIESMVVSLKTNGRGPRRRGRLFLPFPAETTTANGVMSSSIRTAMNTAWANFVADLDTTLVVASYAYATDQAVTTAIVDNVLHAQRRRAKQLGPG